MSSTVKAIPEGYHSITPYLIVQNAAAALEFYKKALGAQERMRMNGPNGKICHAEMQIGDSVVMLADECPEMNVYSPQTTGKSSVHIHIYTQDVDSFFARAIAAGATSIRPLQNQFYGDRSGCFQDPYGHVWGVATHIEDVTYDEMLKRMQNMQKACA